MISIEGLNGVSQLKKQCDLGKVLLDTMNSQKFDLKDGDILEYEEINTDKGLQAHNVSVIGEEKIEEKEDVTQ